jgi:hypothetical protein
MEQQKKSILEEAAELVRGPRAAAYGTPAENHGRTAALWSAYLGTAVSARDVCMLNVLQKLSRDRHSPGRDNLVDVAGYAENAQRIYDALGLIDTKRACDELLDAVKTMQTFTDAPLTKAEKKRGFTVFVSEKRLPALRKAFRKKAGRWAKSSEPQPASTSGTKAGSRRSGR